MASAGLNDVHGVLRDDHDVRHNILHDDLHYGNVHTVVGRSVQHVLHGVLRVVHDGSKK